MAELRLRRFNRVATYNNYLQKNVRNVIDSFPNWPQEALSAAVAFPGPKLAISNPALLLSNSMEA